MCALPRWLRWGTWGVVWNVAVHARTLSPQWLDIENNIDLNIFSYIQVQKFYLLWDRIFKLFLGHGCQKKLWKLCLIYLFFAVLPSAAVVRFWTSVRTWTSMNLTEVQFKVQATAGTECDVQSQVQACKYFTEPVWMGSNMSEPTQKPWQWSR